MDSKCPLCGSEKETQGLPDFPGDEFPVTIHEGCPNGCDYVLQCMAPELYKALNDWWEAWRTCETTWTTGNPQYLGEAVRRTTLIMQKLHSKKEGK